ncbi:MULTISPECIES: ATP-dependent nuclease [Halanaerobium]|uniref:AAA domain-containing protein, putative AbiEii toxin, Type IV TA system n=2 Tax=Halanaerobium TaxID=2330 RepID=A0A1I4J5F2_9FIRM|nr:MULTISPECIES: AAA family ATPase [Halanaerobium]SFL61371.1 AAA domain-containing protein, putative AbiEii toxin, Type IV TA system [Halanaerobium salsuginis]SIQ03750.1 AAA domain-containing protein, putative AbiEii toxin, Type IV TA system [Halanaerobium kushneri]
MYIKEIAISGYKTLVDFKFEEIQEGLNILVGKNNVGKSNILKALEIFFTRQGTLRKDEIANSFDSFLNNRDNIYMEIVFANASNMFNNNENEVSLKIDLNENNRKYMLKKQGKYINMSKNSFFKNNPKYIYFGDLNEINFNSDDLQQLYSINNSNERRKIETNASQFLQFILNTNINISINIKNDNTYSIDVIDSYGNSNLLSNKSSGLQQLVYLGLVFSFNLLKKPENIILGIEEPESNLHTSLQKRLFKRIREISEAYSIQIFLTTHSPIFIDKFNHKSVHHVKRNNKMHTKVLKESYRNNWFDIRKDLGLGVNDSLFVGEFNLLVEGPTEKIIFPKIIKILHDKDLISFSEEDINLLSAQGASNLHYFSKLISQMELPTIVLVDKDQEGNNAKDKIEEDNFFNKLRVISLDKEEYEECEIEDLISDDILLKSINELYNSSLNNEDLLKARKNEHHEEAGLIKFSKAFKKLDLEKDRDLSKLNLATKIKSNLDEESDLKLIQQFFIEMDSFYKEFM